MIPYAGKDETEYTVKGEYGKRIWEFHDRKIRKYFSTHLCAKGTECAKALHISATTVSKHVVKIRGEWVEWRLL